MKTIIQLKHNHDYTLLLTSQVPSEGLRLPNVVFIRLILLYSSNFYVQSYQKWNLSVQCILKGRLGTRFVYAHGCGVRVLRH